MTRVLAVVASLVLAGSVAAFAQTHPSHSQGRPHDTAGHMPIDPELHALMHGDWHGTLSTPGGAPSALDLKVARSEAGKLTFHMNGDRSVHFGAATQFAVAAGTIQWDQEVSGAICRATAKAVPATATERDTLEGTISCAHREMTFALRKTE